MTKSFQGNFEFNSPINKENSFTSWNLSKDAKSIININIKENGYGYFEWEVPELDEYVEGGLWFDENELTDYDGVFELPSQLVKYLEEHGYNVDYAK